MKRTSRRNMIDTRAEIEDRIERLTRQVLETDEADERAAITEERDDLLGALRLSRNLIQARRRACG